MRVKKICTNCGKLKSMYDFLPSEEFVDKKTRECRECIKDAEFEEYNSKINNNKTSSKMATLKEKREAAKAQEGNTAAPVTDKPAATPKPKKETPKVGETTKDGLTVVGEKKEGGQRGRKAAEEKPIEQLNKETGEVIATFNTLQEAADAVGSTKAYILDGLKGWVKAVKGFQWRYKGEEVFVRVKKETTAEKEFVKGGKKDKPAKETTADVPVPGDLDYDLELHAPKEVVEEEILDSPEENQTEE